MSVCLCVAYIGPKSRTERPRKTKIGTEVAHVTRDSDTTFKVKRSRSLGRFAHCRVGASGSCSDGRENVLVVGNCCYVAVCSAAQGALAPTERRGRGISWGRPPTACYCYDTSLSHSRILGKHGVRQLHPVVFFVCFSLSSLTDLTPRPA